ncbi:unnamed protein product [Cylicocyclus nassatus]|uniref:Uncharacterized protein n=1 Tax=Cylicocyclus nassatus TaxID=53992 RepID=A0AA36M5W5_CYLNA|nr:unnamed protein product [Cylicocyclus nassatus]
MHFCTIVIFELLLVHVPGQVSWVLIDLEDGETDDGISTQAVYVFRMQTSGEFECLSSIIPECTLKYIRHPSDDLELCQVITVFKPNNRIYELRCRRRKELLHEGDWIKKTLNDFIIANNTSAGDANIAGCVGDRLKEIDLPEIPTTTTTTTTVTTLISTTQEERKEEKGGKKQENEKKQKRLSFLLLVGMIAIFGVVALITMIFAVYRKVLLVVI